MASSSKVYTFPGHTTDGKPRETDPSITERDGFKVGEEVRIEIMNDDSTPNSFYKNCRYTGTVVGFLPLPPGAKVAFAAIRSAKTGKIWTCPMRDIHKV